MSRGGSPSVISDAGPLIGLARIGRLEILRLVGETGSD